MHAPTLISGADTMIIMLPFLALMLLVMFRLDEHFAAPKSVRKPGNKKTAARMFCEVAPDGQPFFTDPDGRPWR